MVFKSKRFIAFIGLCVFGAILFASVPRAADAPSQSPKSEQSAVSDRVKKFVPAKISDGLTLVPLVGNAKVQLVDIRGQIVNEWNVDASRARLLPNGNILVIHTSRWGRKANPWRKMQRLIREYDWSGNVAWEFKARDNAHHDLLRLPNGNTIYLERTVLEKNGDWGITDPARKGMDVRSDSVVEVDRDGNVVWEWHAHEHLDINSCGFRGGKPAACAIEGKKMGPWHDWTHMNTIAIVPENQWFRAGHTEFRPGNLVLMPRNLWMAIIVDRESGKTVWEYRGDYNGGLSASHEPHMIEEGMPGAGNILIFDNGVEIHDGESYILEINPVTKELVWVYDRGREFYSRRRGAVQRLPNGNTLISEDQRGRCFEVTPDKEIVWSYEPGLEINRCYRYPADYLK